MPSTHALLSASGAARWLQCPPSARLCEKFPDTTSEFAREGTDAHELCELKLRHYFGEMTEAEYLSDHKWFTENSDYYSKEMDDCSDAYVDLIDSKMEAFREANGQLFEYMIEEKVDFSKYVPNGFGTSDCILILDDLIEVIDFKYGKGVEVSAVDNPQMKLYALGAYLKLNFLYDFKTVRMTIFQPRISPEPSEDEISVPDLLDWAENYVKPRAQLAIKGEGEFSPSPTACKFCRAKGECKARAAENVKAFDGIKDPALLTDEEAAEYLTKAADFEAWLKDLKDYISQRIGSGHSVPGYKLVEGRSVRRFSDELAAAKVLMQAGYDEALIYSKNLLSITQLEKSFGKKEIQSILGPYIEKPRGNPTLVPEKDKRPALENAGNIVDAFD